MTEKRMSPWAICSCSRASQQELPGTAVLKNTAPHSATPNTAPMPAVFVDPPKCTRLVSEVAPPGELGSLCPNAVPLRLSLMIRRLVMVASSSWHTLKHDMLSRLLLKHDLRESARQRLTAARVLRSTWGPARPKASPAPRQVHIVPRAKHPKSTTQMSPNCLKPADDEPSRGSAASFYRRPSARTQLCSCVASLIHFTPSTTIL